MTQPSIGKFQEERAARDWFTNRFGEAEAEEGELTNPDQELTPPSKEKGE